jgi:hypothetical protein
VNNREHIIHRITTDKNFREICKRINNNYADDIFQEVCVEVLEMPEHRLPDLKFLNFWFYRVAFNIFSKRGKLGSIIHKPQIDIKAFQTSEQEKENLIREAEKFMLNLSEFENRVVLLYNQLGDMKKVQRATGISYSALRMVKEKIKKLQ